MSNDPSLVDNTAGAHDDVPAPGGAGNTAASKTPWYLSYILWTNIAALLSMLLPSVRDWLASNPVEFTTALGAVNVLLQFISGGKYQLTGEDGQSGQSGNPAGVLPRPVATGADATSPVEDRSQDPNQDPSSMSPSSGSSSPLSGSGRLMLVLGALMVLLGGSCSSTDADPIATSVALTDGQVVVIRGGSSLVVDRTEHKLLWSQAAPEVVLAPVVQATSK